MLPPIGGAEGDFVSPLLCLLCLFAAILAWLLLRTQPSPACPLTKQIAGGFFIRCEGHCKHIVSGHCRDEAGDEKFSIKCRRGSGQLLIENIFVREILLCRQLNGVGKRSLVRVAATARGILTNMVGSGRQIGKV